MQVIKFIELHQPNASPRTGLIDGERIIPFRTDRVPSLSSLLHAENPEACIHAALEDEAGAGVEMLNLKGVRLLAPIDRQEVWGAGVTYLRSKVAREEESESAAVFYDRVYTADRPELFFKATPHRVVGPDQPVAVRPDTRWTVPEPEVALYLSPEMRLTGFTIGNDMSARDIEGDNPLYLPQAKMYDACCALGPAVTLVGTMPEADQTTIRMTIRRGGEPIFLGESSLTKMRRSFDELIDWLGRANSFPDGVILLTGTGIVPPDEFTLEHGDHLSISVDGIGTLENPVVRLEE